MKMDFDFRKEDKWTFMDCFKRLVYACWYEDMRINDKDIISHMKDEYGKGDLHFINEEETAKAEFIFDTGRIHFAL